MSPTDPDRRTDGLADGATGESAVPETPRRATYYDLVRAVLYREFLIFVRYPANAVGGLERHVTTPFGFAPVALLKGVAKVVRTFLLSAVVLGVMLLLTGTTLSLDPITVVVVAGLSITSVLGLGFAAGGITVLYKRVGNWLNLLQFGFVVLVSAPVFDAPWTRILPLAHGSALLQRAMVDGVRLWEFPLLDLGLLVAVSAGYLAAGYLVFRYATLRARRLGVLGDY